MGKTLGVIGCGPWATTIANLAAAQSSSVLIWCHSQDYADVINQEKRHPVLTELVISSNVIATTDLKHVLDTASMIIYGIASSFIKDVDLSLCSTIDSTPFLVLTKGLQSVTSDMLIAPYLQETFSIQKMAVLSGPNLAAEIALGQPAATVIASNHLDVASQFQVALSGPTFRVYTSNDVIGVSLGGILKNPIAIAAGICDGLNLGENAKSSLVTRGLHEMIQIGKVCGAKTESFYGLSGVGDLMATCHSSKSRNWQFGHALTTQSSVDEALAQISTIPEGYKTLDALIPFIQKHQIDCPIIQGVCDVVFHQKSPKDIMIQLMSRALKSEQA